jgi:hypothetical protein
VAGGRIGRHKRQTTASRKQDRGGSTLPLCQSGWFTIQKAVVAGHHGMDLLLESIPNANIIMAPYYFVAFYYTSIGAKPSPLVCSCNIPRHQRTASNAAGTALFESAWDRGLNRQCRFDGDHYDPRLRRTEPFMNNGNSRSTLSPGSKMVQSEIACTVDRDEQIQVAFHGLRLGDADMEDPIGYALNFFLAGLSPSTLGRRMALRPRHFAPVLGLMP